MQTLIAVIALAGSIASGNIPDRPRWQSDYFEARSRAIEVKRPLAVFIGSNKTDWQLAARDSADPQVSRCLGNQYVCVFVDTDTTAGKKLAADFAVNGKGLVISDRSGNSQQFHHSGEVSRDDLIKALERYADPDRAFRATESLAQLSPPPDPPAHNPHSYAPAIRLSGG
jgi:hypothetical protein